MPACLQELHAILYLVGSDLLINVHEAVYNFAYCHLLAEEHNTAVLNPASLQAQKIPCHG
jgi:hypothetical protein